MLAPPSDAESPTLLVLNAASRQLPVGTLASPARAVAVVVADQVAAWTTSSTVIATERLLLASEDPEVCPLASDGAVAGAADWPQGDSSLFQIRLDLPVLGLKR